MNIAGIIITFAVTWWMVFFMALPIGNLVNSDAIEKGHASSAPDNPRLWLKAALTTLITSLLTGIFFYLMYHGYLDMIELRKNVL